MPFKKKMPQFRGKDEQKSPYPGTRIAKVVARAGLGSRRDVEDAIEQGRVSVNGRTITSPALNVLPEDKITLDGRVLPQREHTRLWLYHKPKGCVTTERDPEGRPTVFDNLPEDLPRVMSVGRLDINTEGLLLLTNDGELKRVLELPATGWLRRYRVRAFGEVTNEQLASLANGVSIDGIDYGPVEAELERGTGDNIWLIMGIREGKNREIKHIAEHLGLAVNRLIRISFGPFQLRDLKPGEAREVSLRLLQQQLGPRLIREAKLDFSGKRREHAAPRLEKRGYKENHAPRATAKAERYARLQEDDTRRISRDDGTQQLRLEQKSVQDRKGRKISVGSTTRTRGRKNFDNRFQSSEERTGDKPFRKRSPGGFSKDSRPRFDRDGEKNSRRKAGRGARGVLAIHHTANLFAKTDRADLRKTVVRVFNAMVKKDSRKKAGHGARGVLAIHHAANLFAKTDRADLRKTAVRVFNAMVKKDSKRKLGHGVREMPQATNPSAKAGRAGFRKTSVRASSATMIKNSRKKTGHGVRDA